MPDALYRDFEWKLLWGRELYEEVIAGSGEPTLEYARSEYDGHWPNARTRWTQEQLDRASPRPRHLLDFGCGVGGQSAVFAYNLPRLRIDCREMTREGARIGETFAGGLYGNRARWTQGSMLALDDMDDVDAINAQEVLEHVFDLDATLDAVRPWFEVGGLLVCSFPFGDWEAPVQWPNLRQHVRLVLPQDCRELFAGHEILALDQLSAGQSPQGWDCGWTMVAVRYSGRPFGRINMERHWEALG